MPKFNYQARTKKGNVQTGTVEAASREAAVATLQGHNLIVIDIESVEAAPVFSRSLKFLQRVKRKEIVVFSRQLSTLIEAKVPLVQALKTLHRQISNPYFKEIVFEMAADVDGGMSLSQALGKHPKVFSGLYINMVKSGEVSGNLDESLTYIADHLEKEYYLIAKVRGAMMYPAFIITGFILAGFVMMTMVVPQLTSILTETEQELPLATRALIGTSNFLKSFWWLVIIAAIAIIGGIVYFIRTPEGRKFWDRIKLKIPILGGVSRKIYITRFAENLGTLIKGGLPIIRSLKVTGDVVGNTVYKDLISTTAEEVKGGNTIASVFERSLEIPPMVAQMIAIGEKSGRLDSILKNIADSYSKEVDNTVSNLAQLIEPILIIILGLGVGVMVAAILMPIYNIAGGM